MNVRPCKVRALQGIFKHKKIIKHFPIYKVYSGLRIQSGKNRNCLCYRYFSTPSFIYGIAIVNFLKDLDRVVLTQCANDKPLSYFCFGLVLIFQFSHRAIEKAQKPQKMSGNGPRKALDYFLANCSSPNLSSSVISKFK